VTVTDHVTRTKSPGSSPRCRSASALISSILRRGELDAQREPAGRRLTEHSVDRHSQRLRRITRQSDRSRAGEHSRVVSTPSVVKVNVDPDSRAG
jgi:hypothetical protein